MSKFGWWLFGIATLVVLLVCYQTIQQRVLYPVLYGRGNVVRFNTEAAKGFIVYGKDVRVTVMTLNNVLFNEEPIPPVWSGNPVKSATFSFTGDNLEGVPTRINFRWKDLFIPWESILAGAYFEFSAPNGVYVLAVPLGMSAVVEVAWLIIITLVGLVIIGTAFSNMFREKQPEPQPQPAQTPS